MSELPPIVHIVVGHSFVDGAAIIVGTFFCDMAAKRLSEELASDWSKMTVESWVIGDDGAPTESLIKPNVYEVGDCVAFDDGEKSGTGEVEYCDGDTKTGFANVLYRIHSTVHGPVYMIGSDIKGKIGSKSFKKNLPL